MEESPELAQIATDSFTARERRIMDSASTRSDWLHAFFRCWTQKEAVTKADGRGLNLPLQSFEVPIAPISAKRGGSHVQVETDGSTVEYLVSELALGEGYAAALAVQPENATVRRYRFSPSLLSGSAA
jgi:4'-phosphopantetheinyl transferase